MTGFRWFSDVLLITGASLIGFVLWSEMESRNYQASQMREFEQSISEQRTLQEIAPVAPKAPPPIHQSRGLDPLLIGRLEVPRLGLDVMVREGTESNTLRKAVGHLRGTALPGQPGNFVVAGHRDSFFRDLRSIQNGDEIRVTTLAGNFTYRVDALSVVAPDDLNPIQGTTTPAITLITCFPFDYVGPAPRRFIVRAVHSETK
jgi:sortase A